MRSHKLGETAFFVIARLNLIPSTNISGRVLNQVHVSELE